MNRASVLVFLKTAWAPEGLSASATKRFNSDEALRRRVLEESPHGTILKHAFGGIWFNRISWKAPEDTAEAIAAILNACKPRVVGAIGIKQSELLRAALRDSKYPQFEHIKAYMLQDDLKIASIYEFAASIISHFQSV